MEEGESAAASGAAAPADPPPEPPAEPEAHGRAGAEAEAEPGSYQGAIRPDAGTHATGPNPVVTDADVAASPTGPNPIVSAKPAGAEAEPEAEAEAAEAKTGPLRSDGVLEPAHIASPVPVSTGTRAPEVYRVPEPGPEPSWGTVLATTVSLWASRRFGRGRSPSGRGTVAVYGATDTPAPASSRWGGVRWPLVVFVLLLVILALVGLQLSGALDPGHPGQSATGPGRNASGSGSGSGSLAGATAARDQAASWMAGQVTSSDLIACDPLMCSTLTSDGVAASRLMSIQPTSTDPLGADVVAATATIRSQFGSRLVSEYAPELIASFGSGTSRVDIRAVANDGAAAFLAKEQADLTARRAAGAQLLSKSFHVPAQGASQIRSGQVDSRVLVTLAALLSQRPVQVSSFGATDPGAPVLYRQVTVVNAPGQTGTTALAADLKQVQAQRNSFLPAHAQIVHLAHGQSALRIEFGAPDQPGLLSGGNS